MKKILFFAFALAAGALAFSSCEPNDPKQPSQADFKPADLVNTMWRADSVFVDGGSGPHFFLNIFAADKAELNGDTVSYHFNGNRLICNRGEYDVTAFYGETAMRKAEYLLEKGWYCLSGSDCHRFKAIKSQYDQIVLKKNVVKALEKIMGEYEQA